MATVTLDHVNKVYSNGFHAVHDLSMDIGEGEFMVLVGPSGCGKTTALRMVAGLEEITDGTLSIGGKVVNDQTPKERDIAMVFQNYALYPHMTVAANIGFGLKLRKLPKSEIAAKVLQTAEILGLSPWLDRKPGQLSGGQRQRVAMGRAIVREPSVFLMDEPLSNLDAKLRVQMRAEVQRIQRRINVATIYVTHDQVEAMTMGDRVAVMRSGVLQQVDRPQVLYSHPDNLFVAAFIGSPAMNLYEASLTEDAGTVRLGSQDIQLPQPVRAAHPALAGYAGQKVILGLRPEHLPAAGHGAAGPPLTGTVDLVEALGSELMVHFTIDARRVRAEGATSEDEDATAGSGERRGPRRPERQGHGGREDHVRRERRGYAVLRPRQRGRHLAVNALRHAGARVALTGITMVSFSHGSRHRPGRPGGTA
jgi:multiple sugar transport system ATP-binding protein